MPFDSTKGRSPREIADNVGAPRGYLAAEQDYDAAVAACATAGREVQAATTAGGAGEAKSDRVVNMLWAAHAALEQRRKRAKTALREQRPAYAAAILAALAKELTQRSERMQAAVAALRTDAHWIHEARMAVHLRGGAEPQNVDGMLDELARFAMRQGRT